MPAHAPRSLAATALFAVALTLAACTTITGPREWSQAVGSTDGETYTITVRDTTGRIDDVDIDPANVAAPPDAVTNPAGQPNVLLVQWTGGACDDRTDIDIAGNGQRLAITIRTTVRPVDCDAIGVGHLVRLTAGEPLPANAVAVTSAP